MTTLMATQSPRRIELMMSSRRSKLHRHVQQMILPGEQSKRDSAEREQNCVRAKPNSVTRKHDKTNSRNYEEDDSDYQRPAEIVKRAQPGIDRVAKNHDMFEALAKRDRGCKNENHLAKANHPRKKVQNTVDLRREQWALVTSADKNRDRPKQHGQEREQ